MADARVERGEHRAGRYRRLVTLAHGPALVDQHGEKSVVRYAEMRAERLHVGVVQHHTSNAALAFVEQRADDEFVGLALILEPGELVHLLLVGGALHGRREDEEQVAVALEGRESVERIHGVGELVGVANPRLVPGGSMALPAFHLCCNSGCPRAFPPHPFDMLVFSRTYQVRPAEVDPQDRLTLPSFLDLFQDLAGQHADTLGFGMGAMFDAGTAWVLNRLVVETHPLPRTAEQIRLETWPSGLERVYAHRDLLAYDADGDIIARGTSRWLTIDVAKRRPLRINEALADRVPQDRERALVPDDFRIPRFEAAGSHIVLVRFSDLDINDHAHNVQYARWFVEAMDDAFLRSHRQTALDLTVRAETGRGDVLRSEVSTLTADGRFLHRLVRESDGREVASGWTRWAPAT